MRISNSRSAFPQIGLGKLKPQSWTGSGKVLNGRQDRYTRRAITDPFIAEISNLTSSCVVRLNPNAEAVTIMPIVIDRLDASKFGEYWQSGPPQANPHYSKTHSNREPSKTYFGSPEFVSGQIDQNACWQDNFELIMYDMAAGKRNPN